MDIIWRLALIIFPISKVDPWLILLREKRALGAFKPTVSGIGFYLHKRFRRGRGRDLIYTKNVARPRFGFYLRNEFRAAGVRFLSPSFFSAWFNKNLVNKMSAIVNTTSALHPLILQNLLRITSEYCLTYKVVWSMVRSVYGDEADENRHLNEKRMLVQWYFKKVPRCARLGAMLIKGRANKNVHFQRR